MSQEKRIALGAVMRLAWQFVKRNGYSLSEALRTAWANVKLKARMQSGIVRFYYRKVDGSIREAFGTLAERLVPPTNSNDTRKKNDTIQTYYDTEIGGWRCFKVANLLACE